MPLRLLWPLLLLLQACAGPASAPSDQRETEVLRVATFNAALRGEAAGELIQRLSGADRQASAIAAIIQTLRPDLLLINEFDYDPEGRAQQLFRDRFLAQTQHGRQPIEYPYVYSGPVNTGVPSGLDLDGDGRSDGPGDAWGYGRYPGQYGMLVLSRYPMVVDDLRSFQSFPWAEMPEALKPQHPESSQPFWTDAVWRQIPLSSKAHWDLPIDTPLGRLHFLVSHPTPPAFDGAERRNVLRNHDENRLWSDYLDPERSGYLYDHQGRRGGLARDRAFVLAGDFNADPNDGRGEPGSIAQLLQHSRVLDYPAPRSEGGHRSALRLGGLNRNHRGDPAEDTAEWNPDTVGNLRVDYVLPSRQFEVVASGVFWPPPEDPDHALISASDHRLVWLDLVLGSDE